MMVSGEQKDSTVTTAESHRVMGAGWAGANGIVGIFVSVNFLNSNSKNAIKTI